MVIPSICPETYCFTLDKSFLCGIPVVCTPFGIPAERVREHGCGWVLERIDAAAILAKLNELVENWDEYCQVRRRIGALALNNVRDAAARYAALYREASRRGKVEKGPLSARRLLATIAELEKGHPYQVPWSRQVAGRAVDRCLEMLEGLHARHGRARGETPAAGRLETIYPRFARPVRAPARTEK